MVLLLAAAYTYYTTQQSFKDDATPPAATENRTRADQVRSLVGQARRGGSDLVQQTLVRCTSSSASMTTTTTTTTTSPSRKPPGHAMTSLVADDSVFTPQVRREWIHAVFGRLEDNIPKRGTGLAGLGEYVSYTANISHKEDRLGMTLCRWPLGLYVRHVEPHSEASLAGIQVDSVLVSLNGLALLAEPSRAALERLWQYEGHDEDKEDEVAVTDPSTNPSNGKSIREPVVLTLMKRGRLYTVVLLSNPPWGISWAPCANVALVRRVSAHCALANVQPGSIVLGIHDSANIYMLDHVAAATQLQELVRTGARDVRITFGFIPREARTGFYERPQGERNASDATIQSPVTRSHDGVQVKFHPLIESAVMGGLCNATAARQTLEESSSVHDNVRELAELVAAGEIHAPTGMEPRQQRDEMLSSRPRPPGRPYHPPKMYGPCPSLPKEQLLEAWDPIQALLFCLSSHSVKYDEDKYVGELFEAQGNKSPMQVLASLTSAPRAAETVGNFLLQFISLICLPDKEHNDDDDEKKTPERPSRKNANELTAMLLKLSRRDEGFCQRLYFILRSYISTLETRRPAIGNQDDGSRNLMALLNCLELLRFAEQQLADRVISSKLPPPSRRSLADDSVASSLVATSVSSSSPSPISNWPVESSPGGRSQASKKKKRVFGFLRKKPSKSREKTNEAPHSPNRPNGSAGGSSPDSRNQVSMSLCQSPSVMYDNMSDFLGELDNICSTIERSLQKSFRQKIAEWALQPWSASKDSALAKVTAEMRDSLRQARDEAHRGLLVNPVESTELLSSIDYDECYILPSAHFPLLLTFNVSERRCSDSIMGEERLYRTRVKVQAIRGPSGAMENRSFVVRGALAGRMSESGESSILADSSVHVWDKANILSFDNRSSWGAPQTLSLQLSATVNKSEVNSEDSVDERRTSDDMEEVGFCWVDLTDVWPQVDATGSNVTVTRHAQIYSPESTATFDQHGDLACNLTTSGMERFELELKVTTDVLAFDDEVEEGNLMRKRMLLYKHDDDLRQDAFTIQYIRTCDDLLKASGLDMKLMTFQCVPVGTKRGFVEWVPGSVPLSEICHPFAGSALNSDRWETSELTPSGVTKFQSLRRLGSHQHDSLRRLGRPSVASTRGSFGNNPVQDYLRSVAYDADAPYLIHKDVMDTYVKSCAGYSVITYILGVGDRHLDNLLLHHSGCFFHCDYSFILGSDPKTYLPMRITDDMIQGLGGKDSDNYAKLLSLMGAAFLALRRPVAVRTLLSIVRLMEASYLPDTSENQSIEDSILGLRQRLRLDLCEHQAVAFIEELVETSLSSKMWIAVDAIHNIGKKL